MANAELLRSGRELNLRTITWQYKNDTTIHKFEYFILSDKNISSVVFGTKVVLWQSIGEKTLPKLIQKTPIYNMYHSYIDSIAINKEDWKFSSFYKTCNLLTATGEAMLSSIDYIARLLVNETCEILQDIIKQICPNEYREDCTKLVSEIRNFI